MTGKRWRHGSEKKGKEREETSVESIISIDKRSLSEDFLKQKKKQKKNISHLKCRLR
jgi:hypothetical protein